jgi:hypothetical protein
MSTLVLPDLKGVKIDVKRTAMYSTQIQQSTSGLELRSAFWTYPRYKIALSFEFLRSASYTRATMNEWETLIGFFARMAGTYDTFYFQMPDDYYVGNLTNYKENATVPATSAYTITVTNTTGWNDGGVYDVTATRMMTKVSSSPAAGQYSCASGIYTFNSADASHSVIITYTTSIPTAATSMPIGVGNGTTAAFQLQRTLVPSASLPAAASRSYFPTIGDGYEPVFVTNSTPAIYVDSTLKTAGTHYNISNGIVTFTSGNIPTASQIISWTGSYYWNVRLEKDEYDFQRMVNGIWESKTINLITVKS